jgi:fructokinase
MLIGIDVGGTKMEVLALDRDGFELARKRVSTPRGDYDATVQAVVDLVGYCEQATGQEGSVGLGIPGSPNPQTGLVRNANSTWLNGRPFGADLTAALGKPVRLSNDANCLAVSEAVDGAGVGAHLVFGVILGTGNGGGIAIDGRVHDGLQGVAAEMGHIPLPWMTAEEFPGRECWCGRRGCLEKYISGTGFRLDYLEATGEDRDGHAIVTAMRAGEPAAVANYERYVDRLARALGVIIDILDPDVFVLGGGMSNVDEIYRDLPGLIPQHVFADSAETPVRKAKHGDSSGVRGAAWLWK